MADLRNVLSEAIRDGNPARLTRTGCVNAVLPVVERFLATSRAEVERLRAAEQRVRDLHPGQDESDLTWCMQCSEPTPCTTRRAVEGVL